MSIEQISEIHFILLKKNRETILSSI